MQLDETPAQRLQRLIDENNLIRHQWTDGQHRACLLAAMAPQCGEQRHASLCPAEVMPLWLAYLTPSFDDKGSGEAWPAMVRRYAAVAARWPALSSEAWERARLRALHAAVSEARRYADARHTAALASIDATLAWLDAGAAEEDRERLLRVSWSPVVRAATSRDPGGVWRAVAGAVDMAWTLRDATSGVVHAAWDRMTSAILAAIEAECDLAERAA